MKKTLKQLAQEHATKTDYQITERVQKILEKIYPDEKQTNLQKLYEYASIVMEQQNKNCPKGEIKSIEIEDTYGTHIKININLKN